MHRELEGGGDPFTAMLVMLVKEAMMPSMSQKQLSVRNLFPEGDENELAATSMTLSMLRTEEISNFSFKLKI